MANEPTHIPADEEISSRELILNVQAWVGYLWSRWRFLLIAGILGGVIGLSYAWLKPPMYIATTTFVLESNDSRSGLGRLSGMAAIAGIDLGGDAGGLFQGENILELYKSRTMLAQTMLSKVHPDSNKLLIERYIDYNSIRKSWEDDPVLSSLDFRRNPEEFTPNDLRVRDSVITTFVNAINENILTVDKPDKKLSIIKIVVTSPDEVFSKAFNETLVQKVNDFYIRTKTKKSSENVAILQQKVDSVRAVMEGAIYSAAKVSDATPNLNPTRQVQRIAPAQEAQFSAEANKAMLIQLLQNLEVTKMNLIQELPLIQLVDQPVYPLKVDRIGKLSGIIVGGFFFGFLVLLYLIVAKWYREMMAEEG